MMQDLLIETLSHYGLSEVPGLDSNPEIIAMFAELGYDIKDDSTSAWCSASLSYFAKKCGYEYNKSLSARDWLKLPVVVLKPILGDVTVLWRETPQSWKGHVGLFISQDVHKIFLLGGNQGNSISIAPYSRERLLGFRQLRKLDKIT
jgi:uncharacterized protein (TIGR02594 family)